MRALAGEPQGPISHAYRLHTLVLDEVAAGTRRIVAWM